MWVSMTEGPKGMPQSFPPVPWVYLLCLSPHSRGPEPFCYLCIGSPSTPTHGQTTIQTEGKSHSDTTAEHTLTFSGMAHAPNFSVHKSEGRERSNKQPLWPRCGLHVEHLHTQVIYCFYGMTPRYLWCEVLTYSQGWACWHDAIYFSYYTKLGFQSFKKDIVFYRGNWQFNIWLL